MNDFEEHATLIAEMPRRAEERAKAEMAVREVRAVTPEELIERYGADAIREAAKLLKQERKAEKAERKGEPAPEGGQQAVITAGADANVTATRGVGGQVNEEIIVGDTPGEARVIDRATEIAPLPPEG